MFVIELSVKRVRMSGVPVRASSHLPRWQLADHGTQLVAALLRVLMMPFCEVAAPPTGPARRPGVDGAG